MLPGDSAGTYLSVPMPGYHGDVTWPPLGVRSVRQHSPSPTPIPPAFQQSVRVDLESLQERRRGGRGYILSSRRFISSVYTSVYAALEAQQ